MAKDSILNEMGGGMTPEQIRSYWNDPANEVAIEKACQQFGFNRRQCVESNREFIIEKVKGIR
jgi:hypothetical protein